VVNLRRPTREQVGASPIYIDHMLHECERGNASALPPKELTGPSLLADYDVHNPENAKRKRVGTQHVLVDAAMNASLHDQQLILDLRYARTNYGR
jgi:hypothetical protein